MKNKRACDSNEALGQLNICDNKVIKPNQICHSDHNGSVRFECQRHKMIYSVLDHNPKQKHPLFISLMVYSKNN